jgi:glycosyltransferase involved in cell wall biosynthesis
MSPRILHLITNLERSGTQKQLCLLAEGLLRTGFDIHVCTLAEGGPMAERLRAAGIHITILGKRWTFDPRAIWALKRLVDHLQPDVIHAWGGTANTCGLAAAIGCGKGLVTAYQCMTPFRSSLQLRLDQEIGRRSMSLVANSRSVSEFYVARGLPQEKFQIIPNAVEQPSPPTVTRRQILDEMELPKDSRLIGLVGRLAPHKRVKDAIWAADLLKVIRKDVHLLIFGEGPHGDRLRKFRDQVRIGDKVHFLGQRGDVQRFLPHFDLLWSTSAYEGQSNAILEAMAVGVPIVASDIPGTREFVIHGETGRLVQVGDRAGFAREAHRLLEDAALAHRLGQAGRDYVQREFTVEKMVRQYLEMYNQSLSGCFAHAKANE